MATLASQLRARAGCSKDCRVEIHAGPPTADADTTRFVLQHEGAQVTIDFPRATAEQEILKGLAHEFAELAGHNPERKEP